MPLFKYIQKITLSLFLTGALIFIQTSTAHAEYTEKWEIESFESEITLNSDSSALVRESIMVDFSREFHRGIERSIPYEYANERETPIKLEQATDENGESWKLKTFKENGYFVVQMTTWNDSQLKGKAVFNLEYTVKNAFNFFEDHDEFYWNVNGTDWVVATKSTKATVHLPQEINPDTLKFACYTGTYGSDLKNCSWEKIDPQSFLFKTSSILKAYEGLTIVLGLPAKTVTPPSRAENFWWYIKDHMIIFLPLIILIVMILMWRSYGRDDQSVSNTIMPHYTPPKGLLPSETGTIIDETVDPKDITATIIDFAIKGFIKIKELEKPGLFGKKTDYVLELIKPYETNKQFENDILSPIFPNNKTGETKKISELENSFYRHVPGIKSAIIKQLIKDDYFPHDPESIKATYYIIGGIILFLFVLQIFDDELTTLSLGLSGLIILLFGHAMPRKTKKGTEAYYQLKGLYEYINTAEKDRMKFQEKNNILFEKLLPYAMAFGLIDKWTNAFDGLIKEPPSWYYPAHPWSYGHFSIISFGNNLNNFSSKTVSSLTSQPGSKGGNGAWSGGSGFGGGFSGGGFGGGGGRGL